MPMGRGRAAIPLPTVRPFCFNSTEKDIKLLIKTRDTGIVMIDKG